MRIERQKPAYSEIRQRAAEGGEIDKRATRQR